MTSTHSPKAVSSRHGYPSGQKAGTAPIARLITGLPPCGTSAAFFPFFAQLLSGRACYLFQGQ
jgi:hypothetical protein